jgi:hypothetical protein
MRRYLLLGRQPGRQLRHRDVRLRLDPVEQSRNMRRQLAAARRTALTRRLCRTGATYPATSFTAKLALTSNSRAAPRRSNLYDRLHMFPKIQ